MQARNLAVFILCFQLASGIVAASGVFTVDATPYDTGLATPGQTANLGDGIADVTGNVSGDSDLANGLTGWGVMFSTFTAVRDLLGALIIPYGYLTSIGVPSAFAAAVQVICNLTLAWALVQFMSGRSTSQME